MSPGQHKLLSWSANEWILDEEGRLRYELAVINEATRHIAD